MLLSSVSTANTKQMLNLLLVDIATKVKVRALAIYTALFKADNSKARVYYLCAYIDVSNIWQVGLVNVGTMSQQVWSFIVSGKICFPLIQEYEHLFPIPLPDWPNLPKCFKLPHMNHSSILDSINTPLPGTEKANKSQYHIWLSLHYLAIHLQPLVMKPAVQGFLQPFSVNEITLSAQM